MADVSGLLQLLWWGQSSGTAADPVWPTATVQVRDGRFNRRYAAWDGEPIAATIAGGNNAAPWQAFWEPSEAYTDLPGVYSIHISQAFENNGVNVCTIDLENIAETAHSEGGFVFHAIERGYYSPFRGFAAPGRLGWPPEDQNAWYRKLNKKQQITITQGYLDVEAKTFTGLIDDIDLESAPDRITITCRSFSGSVLGEQRMFGNVKDPYLRSPVTFVDRRTSDKLRKVGYDAKASSEDVTLQYPPEHVLDTHSSYWRSRKHADPDGTEWIQIRVPQGRYQTFYLWPKYANMRAYFSVYAKPRTDGNPTTFGGHSVSEGWIGIGEGAIGTVPGAEGGIPYLKSIENIANQGHYHTFGEGSDAPEAELGPGSIIRVSFRNLAQVSGLDLPPGEPGGAYRAGVVRMIAIKRALTSEALKQRWILVDDVADAVKVILRWAGYKEWNIENTGVRLKRKVTFSMDSFLIDAINKLAESTNYVFFENDPSAADLSIGVPTFRQSRVITEDLARAAVNDTELLTGMQAKITDEPLATVIRVRGRPADDEEVGGAFLIGTPTADSIRRIHYTLFPSWSGHLPTDTNDLAGILKHVVHLDPKLTSVEDCKFAALYIALQQALLSVTGQIEIPAFPGFEIDSFALVKDTGTGMFTRLLIATRDSTMQLGEEASYKQTLAGTWVDTPNVIAVKDLINQAILERTNE